MKAEIKGALIGFIVVFVGLWIVLLSTGSDAGQWGCASLDGTKPCDFLNFIVSPLHWAFVLFFSWVGFAGGYIDTKRIKKILEKRGESRNTPLKITSTIVISLVIIFAIVGLLAFENWVVILLYSIAFYFFVVLITWAVGKWKYH